MALRIYNTLSRQKEPFVPDHDPVRFYCCGMTPKFHPHLGHAKLFVTMDTLRRYLAERGYRVRYVQNFTDVDDKIIARAEREGSDPQTVAQKYTDGYFASMAALNVLPADVYPKATETITGIVAMIEALEGRGYAYAPGNGDVYYRVSAFPSYGKLSRRTEEDVQAGARIAVEEDKVDPRDFALWKAAKPGEPAWPSPWGAGRPGWHIECSAMVRQELGEQIDIHAGGPDLIFPHHENEIAQSEAYCGCEPFSRYWVHIGQLNVGNEKMAHSTENFTTVFDVLERYHPMVLRIYYLSQHYRTPINFTPESLDLAQRALERLILARANMRRLLGESAGDAAPAVPVAPATTGSRAPADSPAAVVGGAADPGANASHQVAPDGAPPASGTVAPLTAHLAQAQDAFYAAMDDDFNTAAALAALYGLGREINRLSDQQLGAAPDLAGLGKIQQTLDHLLAILGLDLPPNVADLRRVAVPSGPSDSEIAALLAERADLRRHRRWADADAIRARLAEQGVVIEDRADGAVWRRDGR